eukprot:12206627-Alexandrium_andersonii.AAC.1
MPSLRWPVTRIRTWLPGYGPGPPSVFSARSLRAACFRPSPSAPATEREIEGIAASPEGGGITGPPQTIS